MKRLVIVGAGYVGLVTGACLADRGQQVVLVDVDSKRVEAINAGIAPFFEPGLDDVLSRVAGQALTATTDVNQGLAVADLTMLAVGTPSTNGSIDLHDLKTAIESVGKQLDTTRQRIVIVKSTVVPGTTDRLIIPLLEKVSGLKEGLDFGVAVNPEFLTEGSAVDDFVNPDRIVIGARQQATADAVAGLYEGFNAPIVATSPATAEMIKYASNTLLSTLISFSNEIANLGRRIGGIDVVDVMRGLHSSRYLTTMTSDGPVTAPLSGYLAAGCGFGGSCLPKDTEALAEWGESLGEPMRVLRAVSEVNRKQPEQVVGLLEEHLGVLAQRRIGILGLAFKPDTDDIRESPAFPIIRSLVARDSIVLAHDPRAIENARGYLSDVPDVEFITELPDLLARVDAVILVTRWEEYQDLPRLLASFESAPLVVDGRRMLEPSSVARYAGIGR